MAGKITQAEIVELVNLYHLARVQKDSRYERMVLAAKWFHQEHPDISSTRAYKELDAATRHGIIGSPTRNPSKRRAKGKIHRGPRGGKYRIRKGRKVYI